MSKLTFKQFLLESREQLISAIDNTPISTVEYKISDYCALKINEGEHTFKLKPKNMLVVEWDCTDKYAPTPVSVSFKGLSQVDETTLFPISIPAKKFNKFIESHSTIVHTVGYK
jgi:hypothetical protein